MAHEILEHDKMLSVRERPWHGLGVVLTDYPTIQEAKEQSGLTWTASTKPSYFEASPGEFVRIPKQHAVVRDDINIPIGAVGGKYDIYQNEEMWKFIEAFQMLTKCKIETAGSLKNGAVTWVLAKNGTAEYITGDPIEEYFLFRNSFDGSSNIMNMFTNIRVVCANTMSMAIRNSNNIFKVRHTTSAGVQLEEVQKALGMREKYRMKFGEIMAHLASFQMDVSQTKDFLENIVFPMPQKIVQLGGQVVDVQEASKRAVTARTNRLNKVQNLIEDGYGTDIPGVKGTAYGVFQALVEWSDHEKSIKVTKERNRDEVIFENNFWGTGADFKQECFNALLAYA